MRSTSFQHDNGVTRRNFLKGVAASSVGLAAAGAITGCSTSEASSCMPDVWDYEADVVVAGFGSAGGMAAIEAAAYGSTVIILESMPEALAGGDSTCFAGFFVPSGADGLLYQAAGMLDRATADARGAAAAEAAQLMLDAGLKKLNDYIIDGGSLAYYAVLKQMVLGTEGVEVLYETPAVSLIQDPFTKEVYGVQAKQGDVTINVKAKQGVIMCTSDYAANNDFANRLTATNMVAVSAGAPSADGSGLMMCMDAGGALMGMGRSPHWMDLAFRKASEEVGTGLTIRWLTLSQQGLGGGGDVPLYDSRVFVNMKGQRFMNEDAILLHDISSDLGFLSFDGSMTSVDKGWRNMPFFMICDDDCIKSTPLGKTPADESKWTWAQAMGIYDWSEDNSAEIERGWIIKADTIEELAAKIESANYITGAPMTMDAEGLAATIAKYNEYCAAGTDPEFGKLGLKQVKTGPFYAAELCPCIIYGIGGLQTDIDGVVLDYSGNPIPRLHAAGNIAQAASRHVV